MVVALVFILVFGTGLLCVRIEALRRRKRQIEAARKGIPDPGPGRG